MPVSHLPAIFGRDAGSHRVVVGGTNGDERDEVLELMEAVEDLKEQIARARDRLNVARTISKWVFAMLGCFDCFGIVCRCYSFRYLAPLAQILVFPLLTLFVGVSSLDSSRINRFSGSESFRTGVRVGIAELGTISVRKPSCVYLPTPSSPVLPTTDPQCICFRAHRVVR